MTENPDEQDQQVVIIGPDGQPMGSVPASAISQMTQDGESGEEGDGEERAR